MALAQLGVPSASLPRVGPLRLSVHGQVEGVPGNPGGGALLSAGTALPPPGPCTLPPPHARPLNKGLLSPAHCGHVDPKEKGSFWASNPTPDPSLPPFAGPEGLTGLPASSRGDSLRCSFSRCWYLTHARQTLWEGQKQGRGWLPATGLGQGCGASQGPLLHPTAVSGTEGGGSRERQGPEAPSTATQRPHPHILLDSTCLFVARDLPGPEDWSRGVCRS